MNRTSKPEEGLARLTSELQSTARSFLNSIQDFRKNAKKQQQQLGKAVDLFKKEATERVENCLQRIRPRPLGRPAFASSTFRDVFELGDQVFSNLPRPFPGPLDGLILYFVEDENGQPISVSPVRNVSSVDSSEPKSKPKVSLLFFSKFEAEGFKLQAQQDNMAANIDVNGVLMTDFLTSGIPGIKRREYSFHMVPDPNDVFYADAILKINREKDKRGGSIPEFKAERITGVPVFYCPSLVMPGEVIGKGKEPNTIEEKALFFMSFEDLQTVLMVSMIKNVYEKNRTTKNPDPSADPERAEDLSSPTVVEPKETENPAEKEVSDFADSITSTHFAARASGDGGIGNMRVEVTSLEEVVSAVGRGWKKGAVFPHDTVKTNFANFVINRIKRAEKRGRRRIVVSDLFN